MLLSFNLIDKSIKIILTKETKYNEIIILVSTRMLQLKNNLNKVLCMKHENLNKDKDSDLQLNSPHVICRGYITSTPHLHVIAE
jgi:hypothetical protein